MEQLLIKQSKQVNLKKSSSARIDKSVESVSDKYKSDTTDNKTDIPDLKKENRLQFFQSLQDRVDNNTMSPGFADYFEHKIDDILNTDKLAQNTISEIFQGHEIRREKNADLSPAFIEDSILKLNNLKKLDITNQM